MGRALIKSRFSNPQKKKVDQNMVCVFKKICKLILSKLSFLIQFPDILAPHHRIEGWIRLESIEFSICDGRRLLPGISTDS